MVVLYRDNGIYLTRNVIFGPENRDAHRSAMGYDEPLDFGYCTIFRHDIPNPLGFT